MSANRVDIDSAAAAALLATDLRPAIEAAALGVAASIQDVLAPYPPPPPRRPNGGYYIRGRGSFTAKGRLVKASELMNRRWSVRSIGLGARLVNTASYAGWVHGRDQKKLHAKTGWVRTDTAITQVVSSGDARRIVMKAIAKALEGRRP
jgi:hypothetical protein